MNLIFSKGLNCHLACLISIADFLDINYKDAFYSLWTETDFFEDPKYHIYLSRRIIPNLERLGAKLEALNPVSSKEANECFLLIPKGELFIVGISTFFIPWSPFYKCVHEPHYFFCKENNTGVLSCFDPTYNKSNLPLKADDIIPNAFDISRVHKLEATSPQIDVICQAREILLKGPEIFEKLRASIHDCKNNGRDCFVPLIKQINAMINNRNLFQLFLYQYPIITNSNQQLFNKDFFSKWEAVKYGLNKASIIKDNNAAVDEVWGLLTALLREETDMAKEIIRLMH